MARDRQPVRQGYPYIFPLHERPGEPGVCRSATPLTGCGEPSEVAILQIFTGDAGERAGTEFFSPSLHITPETGGSGYSGADHLRSALCRHHPHCGELPRGVDVTGIVPGLLAIIGLVIAFGMKDTVSNFAAGIRIASMNLFENGKEVTPAGHRGTVQEVSIMATQLTAAGADIITIPNGMAWNNSITNDTRNPKRRITGHSGRGMSQI